MLGLPYPLRHAEDHYTWPNHLGPSSTKEQFNIPAQFAPIHGRNTEDVRRHGPRLDVASKSHYEFLQSYYNANQNVRAYANRLRRNWWKAKWHEVQFEPMRYELVWDGLASELLPKLKPFTKAKGKFNSIDELLDWAANVATEQDTYEKQQLKPPSESFGPGGWKRNFRSSISETQDASKNPSTPGKPY